MFLNLAPRRSLGFAFVPLALITALLAALMSTPSGPPSPSAPDAPAQAGARAWTRTAVWAPSYDAGSLLDPAGVSGETGGQFFVADRGHDRIAVVDAAGSIVRTFGKRGQGPAEFNGPTDVAVDAARDRVYVADRGNRRIGVFTLAGAPVGRWTTAGPDDGFVPHALAVVPSSGEVYVLSRLPWGRVERFGADGTWKLGWGETGSGRGQFQWPEDIAVDADGRVLVADTNNDRIQVFGPGDVPVVETVLPLRGVAGVAVEHGSGRVFALHLGAGSALNQVTAYSAQGLVLGTLTSGAPEPFAAANGLGVSADRLAITTGFGAADGRHGLRQFGATDWRPAAATVVDPLAHAGFLRPEAVDVQGDEVFVADGVLHVTKQYDAGGAYARRFDAGAGADLSVAPGGEIFLADAPILGDVRLRRLGRDGTRLWDKVCDCLSGLGVAAAADRVFATLAHRQRVGVFDLSEARREPVAEYPRAGAPYAWPLDLDLGPDERLYIAGGASGRIDVLDPESGAVVGGWSTGEANGPERISVASDGTVFVLRFDGSLAAYTPAGQPISTWRPTAAPGAAVAAPRDLAAGPGGRLYVADAASDAILVYDVEDAARTPTPAATPPPPCTATGDKVARPTAVTLGAAVDLELSLKIRCRAGTEPRADVMLVVDRSNSMDGDKLAKARAAAKRFVAGLDLGRHRVGVVSFSDLVTLDQPLSADGAAILATIDGMRADGRTDIAGALDLALRHIGEAARPEALPVVLLLTDGRPSREGQPYVDAVRQAERARARGALIYSIGLGEATDVDAVLLTQIAGSAARYFYAPQPEDLDAIYDQLSRTIGAVVATDVEVVDELGADVDYVPESAVPAATVEGRRVTWNVGALPADGARFRLKVVPNRTGRVRTNTQAAARYVAEGARYSFTFPVPEVDVRAVPSPTPTRAPTATPNTTTVYLPFLARGLCLAAKDARLGADIVLAIDTSSSMAGAKLDAAVAAARTFLGLVDARRDRVGLVSFNADARREHTLSADFASVGRAVGRMQSGVGTRIDRGIEESIEELGYRGRAGASSVIVVLSDGVPVVGTEERARMLAFQARASAITVFTIGLGPDAAGAFLQELARALSYYYYAPDHGALAEIYRRVAGNLPCR